MRHLPILPRLATVAIAMLGCWSSAAESPMLGDSGLPAGAPELVLPQGAALHVRIANLGHTLETLDALIMTFVPEKAVPRELQPLLGQKQPVLAFIGSQTVGAPINAALIAQITGLAIDRPVTLSLYTNGASLDWILCLPAADRETVSGLLFNVLRPRVFKASAFAGSTGWVVQGTNPDLPQELVILTSSDAIYCCGSLGMATRLATKAAKHLSDDSLSAIIPAQADVAVMASTQSLRPLLDQMLRSFSRLPPRMWSDLRRDLLRNFTADQVNSFNMQLRLRAGMDLEEVLNYGESLASAAVETVVPALGKTLLGIDGFVVGVELRADRLLASMTIQADGIEQLAAQPIPLDVVRKAIAVLPGDRLCVTVEGRSRPATASNLAADWLDLALRKLKVFGHASPFLSGLAAYWRECEKVPTLQDTMPWVLTTSCQTSSMPPKGVGLSDWLAAMQKSVSVLPDLQVFPRQEDGVVARLFSERAAVENRNAARWTKVLTGSLGDDRWVDTVSRFRREPRPGKPERLVYEDAWMSRTGLFGYSQHELINRIIAYATARDSLHLLQRVNGDSPCWLDDAPPAVKPLPPALAALLDQVPAEADSLAAVRILPVFALGVDALDSLEQAARHDLDDYLRRSEAAINAHPGDEQAIIAELMKLPIPLIVSSLNIDTETRMLYLVLPGGLRYPRPALAPVVRRLLTGFLAKVDAGGGSVSWRSSGKRRLTLNSVQHLSGLAWLVKSTGNAVWSEFLSKGDPARRFSEVLGHPDDGMPNDPEQVVLLNTMWGQPN